MSRTCPVCYTTDIMPTLSTCPTCGASLKSVPSTRPTTPQVKLIKRLRAFANFTLYVGGIGSIYYLATKTFTQSSKYKYLEKSVFNEVNLAYGLSLLFNVIFISLILNALATILEGQQAAHKDSETPN